MFYRFLNCGGRIPVDLEDSFSGSCFIAGGAPSLLKENLELLKQPGITVLGMNNTASVIPIDIWVGGDRPKCYSKRILLDPKLIKFGRLNYAPYFITDKIRWGQCPNTYFYGLTDQYTSKNFLKPMKDMVWWKNTFYIALQLAYKLGFRTVYLIGCQFKIDKKYQYSYKTDLSDTLIKKNSRLYSSVKNRMEELIPSFNENNFKVYSSTKGSILNKVLKHISMPRAVKNILREFPKEYNTELCEHSLEMNSGGK